MPDRCEFSWNPGVWPYLTRCVKDLGHAGDHESRTEKTYPAQLVVADGAGRRLAAGQAIVDVLLSDKTDRRLLREKHHVLAVEWPALAAVLNGLLESYGAENPFPSFRRAEQVVRSEQ